MWSAAVDHCAREVDGITRIEETFAVVALIRLWPGKDVTREVAQLTSLCDGMWLPVIERAIFDRVLAFFSK